MRPPLFSPQRLRRAAAVVLAGLALPVTADAARITEFPVAKTPLGITDIELGPDGQLWAVKPSGGLSRFVPTTADAPTGAVETPVTVTGVSDFHPQFLAFGANSFLWVSEGTGRLVRLSTAGQATVFTDGIAGNGAESGDDGVGSLARGTDQADVWFVQGSANTVGRIKADGAVQTFNVNAPGTNSGPALTPERITRGPDGAMWFTDRNNPLVGRIAVDGAGTATVSSIALPALPDEDKTTSITSGPDGSIWVTTQQTIQRINPVSKAVTSFTTGLAGSGINDITAGPDDNLWFVDPTNKRVGRITPVGAMRLFSLEGGLPPVAITSANGNLWYSGSQVQVTNGALDFISRLGRVETTAAPTLTSRPDVPTTTVAATVTGDVVPEGLPTNVQVEYGPTTAYGSKSDEKTFTGIASLAFEQGLTNLLPSTTYHFRLVAKNTKGIAVSEDRTFTTLAVPPVDKPAAGTPPPASIAVTPAVQATTPLPGVLKPAATKVKLSSKGILLLPLSCTGATACTGPVTLTAKVSGKKSATIATKTATLPAGKTTKLGLRLSKAGLAAVKKAKKKGLSVLLSVKVGSATVRYRVILLKG